MSHPRDRYGLFVGLVAVCLAVEGAAATLGPGVFDTPPTVLDQVTVLAPDTTLNVRGGALAELVLTGEFGGPPSSTVLNVTGAE